MTTTYAVVCRALALLLPLAAMGQSLEDKVSQAKRLQAQSMLGLDQAVVDSLAQVRKAQGARRTSRGGEEAGTGDMALDSLLSGPFDPEASDTAFLDSLDGGFEADSLARRPRTRKKPLPKRFEQRIFQTVDRSAFSSAKGVAGRDYVLGPGDHVTVSLWGDKEKEYELELNAEGKVFLEGIGLVPLAGLNLNEAQARLKEKLSRIYSGIGRGSSSLDVTLGKAGPIRVFVLGEVKVPGGYVFTGNTSVLSALYFAQGPSNTGTVRNLQISRGGKKHAVDLYQYLIYGRSIAPDILRDGDIVFSGRADALVEIKGDVARPATYELRKGEGMKDLLEFAGKPNSTAAQHRVTLQRIFPDGRSDYMDLASPQAYLSGAATTELQDGDRVLVEKSTEIPKNFITVAGPVRYPGTYASEGLATLRDLIARAGGLREDAFLSRAHVVRFKVDGSSQLLAHTLDTTVAGSIRLEPRDNVILYSVKEMFMPESVEVAGAVFNPGRYEFREGMTATDLVMQAGGLLPQHESGKLFLFRGDIRDRKVEQIMIDLEGDLMGQAKGFPLSPRDLIHVPLDPKWYTKEVVVLDGLFLRPGKYALLYPGEKLSSVIARCGGFKENAYVKGGRFFRSRDSVGRVGVDIDRAVKKPRSSSNIAMVGGDSLFIPERLSTVKVMGEVGFETSVLFKKGAAVGYYIEKAGGFTRRSEQDKVVVQYANGETSRDGYFNRKPDAGSVIYIPQGPEPTPIDWFSGLNALLGTMGVITAIVLSIQAINQ